jgi:hypothetical protein
MQEFTDGPQVFNAFWHGPPLSAFHWACLASFVELGHTLNLYAYHPLDVPAGVTLMAATEIIPAEEIFFFSTPESPTPDVSPFSDVFRFKLLLERGGWWTDVDEICLRRDIPVCRYAWARELAPPFTGASPIKFPKGDPIVREIYEECAALAPNMRYREEIGPALLTRVLERHPTPAAHFGSTQAFYPLAWAEGFKLWLPDFHPDIRQRTTSSYFISCYGSLASYIGIDLNRRPPPGSYMAEVMDRLALNRMKCEPPYSPDEVIFLMRRWLDTKEWGAKWTPASFTYNPGKTE